MQERSRPVRVAFVHPDLGIGGAERLVVDAALALKNRGYEVIMYTSHHDPNHCFSETVDGTLEVRCYGDFLPRHIFNMLHIFFATLRALYLALVILFTSSGVDLFFVDQVSAAIPVLKLTPAKVLFYCHFPDQLLSHPGSRLKRLYRLPFDRLEEYTTSRADSVVVNSSFTASVFRRTFARILLEPQVLYPSINANRYVEAVDWVTSSTLPSDIPSDCILLLSINRFERKKNIGLAVNSFHQLKFLVNESLFSRLHLALAGGYDERLRENVEVVNELRTLAARCGLEEQVTFVLNFDERQRNELLTRAICVLYTPENEHFGIVPVESMYARVPVIACSSGGPVETVVNGQTGYLCESNLQEFAKAMASLVSDLNLARSIGERGRTWVMERFSFESFTSHLDGIVSHLL